SRRRHTRSKRDWSSDVCSSDLPSRISLPRSDRFSGGKHSTTAWKKQVKVRCPSHIFCSKTARPPHAKHAAGAPETSALCSEEQSFPLRNQAIYLVEIGRDVLGAAVALDARPARKELLGDGVRAHGEVVRVLLLDVHIVHARMPGFGPADVLVRARHILLAV